MRALLLLAVLLLASFGANAQTYCGLPTWLGSVNDAGPGITYPSREEAQAACESVAQMSADPTSGGWFARVQRQSCKLNQANKTFSITANVINSSITSNCGTTHAASGARNASGWKFTGEICPAGSTWNDSLNKCFNPDECLQRNSGLPDHPTVRTYANACVAGCTIKATGPSVGVDGLYTGFYQYSGDQCSSSPTLPDVPQEDDDKDPPQECTPAGGGMTFCLKPDGQQCYTSANGRQTCWRVGETGVKTDGPVAQKRDAGTEAIPPNLNLPNGDVLQQTQGPKTQTTTVTNNGGTTTVTTTTTNYTTTNGTNAGPKNQGESNTGDGSGKEGDSDSENGVSGGSCTAGYTTTGDPLLGAILQEEHKQRCAQEKLKSDMQAVAAAGDGDDGLGSIWDTAGTPLAINEGLVSLGGGGIPDLSFNVDGQSFAPFAGPTSDFIATLRWLIIAAATIFGLYIIWNR